MVLARVCNLHGFGLVTVDLHEILLGPLCSLVGSCSQIAVMEVSFLPDRRVVHVLDTSTYDLVVVDV